MKKLILQKSEEIIHKIHEYLYVKNRKYRVEEIEGEIEEHYVYLNKLIEDAILCTKTKTHIHDRGVIDLSDLRGLSKEGDALQKKWEQTKVTLRDLEYELFCETNTGGK